MQTATLTAHKPDGTKVTIPLKVRLDTPAEVDYYNASGILPHALEVIYGERNELSGHYKRLETQYFHPVHPGKDFWHRLTGDEDFYADLAVAIGNVATESNYSQELNAVINRLAQNLTI